MENKKIKEILTRNISFIKPEKELEKILKSGRVLRVKHGIDPTGKRIHLGRAATLMKLRDFQELGHKVVLIIGDFTALIGDASDKIKERPMLTKEDVKSNMKNYLNEIGRVININECEIRYNSEWLGKLDFNQIAEIADNFSVAEMIDRENFSNRFKKGIRISLREFLYPLMQGFDSVAVKSDIEIGGNDQLFNVLAGRRIQKSYNQKPQIVLGTKLINAIDGSKMSTSLGNCIFIDDSPNEMFGKIMAIKDSEMETYFETLTRIDMKKAKKIIVENPRLAKSLLAKEIVKFFHGEKNALKSEEEFNNVFSKNKKPEKILKFSVSNNSTILDFIIKAKMVKSKSEGRRILEQRGLKINGKTITENDYKISNGDEVQIGKRRWAKVVIKN
jgi:tyrosyl-tRNA synthetase